jgi:putative LysE/RhtB family amino acid efflux pump
MDGNPDLLLRGILLGLAVAMPVGPIGVLCIQRSLAGGFWTGFSGGIGTAAADAVYAALAAAGFAVLAGSIGTVGSIPVQDILRWGGAAFILWLGWRTIMSPVAERAADLPQQGSAVRLFAVTFLLTMSNPATILSFVALFAGLGLAAEPTPDAAVSAVAGVFIGSLLWWAVLSGGVAALRQRIGAESRRWINRIAGAVLIIFAIALVI